MGGGIFVSLFLLAGIGFTGLANAATETTQAKVSFTFDDGLASSYTLAAPTLAEHGLTGVNYVISDCVGMSISPNNCRADNDAIYMTWEQILELQNNFGWEIGSHTVDHKCLASKKAGNDDDCQRKALTPEQVEQELLGSQQALAAQGINATSFSPPYGDYNPSVLAQIAKYYTSMRGFQDQNDNIWPYNAYLLNDYIIVEGTNSVAAAKAEIDRAIENNLWLIFTFHEISNTPSSDPDDYQFATSKLEEIAAYAAQKQSEGLINNVNISQGITIDNNNLLPNASFNNGISEGWTTDDIINITPDNSNNGNTPDPVNSIKLVSNDNGDPTHLFSPKVNVGTNITYLINSFLNVNSISSGVVAFYVDEYDANGNWISGQYLKQEDSVFVENISFLYTPTSLSVSNASLQVIVAGQNITAYLDNVRWVSMINTTEPDPSPANLIINGEFNSGISEGWHTNNSSIFTVDYNNNGDSNDPANSVKISANTDSAHTHLFSPIISINWVKTYSLYAWLDMLNINSGEIAFYIDEYDANGNWISGQYKLGIYATGRHNIGFTYNASSISVAKASLQVILVGNSGITAYLDNIRWYEN
jgi:peptidoglycan/xylan/chitin deacetylase (PgdA/CDA1 family)